MPSHRLLIANNVISLRSSSPALLPHLGEAEVLLFALQGAGPC